MTRYYPLSVFHHFLAFLVCFILIHVNFAATGKPTELVHKICNKTSNYTFCVEALYSDSRTPGADRYTLAYVSFGLAYTNAHDTQGYIAELLKNTSNRDYLSSLKRCSHDYQKAVSALKVAYSDLDSETVYELADLAGDAARASNDCQAALKKAPSPRLASKNSYLKRICEICAIVAGLFTGSS